MRKQIICILLILAVCAMASAAENNEGEAIRMAQGLLMEEYGYTRDEAMTFTYQVQDNGDTLYVRFYQRTDWTYSMSIRRQDMSLLESQTPFATQNAYQASESSIRTVLRAMDKDGWIDQWNVESKAMMREMIDGCGDIRMSDSLRDGLSTDGYTPAQALEDLFISCCGEEGQWPQAVSAWRDAAFESLGLMRADIALTMPRGIATRLGNLKGSGDETSITEFVGEVPGALAAAFAHPMLQGFTCLAGAYQEGDPFLMNDQYAGTGLAAFENGEERLLVMLLKNAGPQAWQVQPVSKTALLSGRELYITFNSSENSYAIRYPLSDTEEERFECRLLQTSSAEPTVRIACQLLEYRRTDLGANTSLVIDSGISTMYIGWYRVTVTKDGAEERTQYLTLAPSHLEYIHADTFPKTAAQCRAAMETTAAVPQGYGVSSYVHLRQKPSSRATDLGMYRLGTLVQVLGTEPGSNFPWYHVRIGTVEGYMSGNYVDYYDDLRSVSPSAVANLAITTVGVALKKTTNSFAQTVEELPAGTVVRVLANSGSWLHISIPQSAEDWLMQPDEISGYISADAVVEGMSALQLEWLMAEE